MLATAISSGMAVFYNSFAAKGVDALAFTLAKNSITALFLVGMLLALGSWREFASLSRKQWLTLGAIAVIGGSIPFALFFWGLSTAASAGGASFIYRFLFFFASAIAVVFLRERPKANTILGVGAILLANLLLLGNFTFGIGEAAVLAATVLWAAEHSLSKKALEGISPTAVASSRLALGCGILLAIAFATGSASALPFAFGIPALISGVLLLIFVLTWYNGLAKIPVSEATAILSFGGIVTALLQFAFAGKMPTLLEGASFALVAAGVAVILWGAPAFSAAYSRFSSMGILPWKA